MQEAEDNNLTREKTTDAIFNLKRKYLLSIMLYNANITKTNRPHRFDDKLFHYMLITNKMAGNGRSLSLLSTFIGV